MVRFRLLFPAVLALALAACDATIHFYPEPVGGDDASKLRLNVDWSDYGKTVPTGMTVICHHTVTGEKKHTIDNNTAYVSPRLAEGRHWATVFNLTEDEYNYIAFRGLDAVESAEAFAPQQQQVPMWYSGRADGNSYLAWPPEWLATDTIMTDHVSHSDSGTKLIGTLHPKNIIYTLHLTIHTENIGNLKSARGSISGMASGRKLAADRPNDNSVTVIHPIEADEWARSRTSARPDIGLVEADIRCFGLPGNHSASPAENILEFQALLADGKTILRYTIPVGHLIAESDPPPGRRGDNLDLRLDLWLDPPLPPGDDSDWGLDVWVDDWEETDDVNIGLI